MSKQVYLPLLVLGDKASRLIDDQITEQWFASYIGEFYYDQKLMSMQQVNEGANVQIS